MDLVNDLLVLLATVNFVAVEEHRRQKVKRAITNHVDLVLPQSLPTRPTNGLLYSVSLVNNVLPVEVQHGNLLKDHPIDHRAVHGRSNPTTALMPFEGIEGLLLSVLMLQLEHA